MLKSYKNAFLKRKVLSLCLKRDTEELLLMSEGRVFQSVGAANAFNAAIMKLGQCAYEFSLGLSLYGVYFCLKLLIRSYVCFCNIAQVSWVCEFFCVGLKFNY